MIAKAKLETSLPICPWKVAWEAWLHFNVSAAVWGGRRALKGFKDIPGAEKPFVLFPGWCTHAQPLHGPAL